MRGLILALFIGALLLGYSSAQADFEWKNAGGNPNQLGTESSIRALGLDESIGVWLRDNYSSEDLIYVGRGDRFEVMNFGLWKTERDVVVDFGATGASRWTIPVKAELELYRFGVCNNWAYRVNYVPLEPNQDDNGDGYWDWVYAHITPGVLFWWLVILSILALAAILGKQGKEEKPGAPGKNGKDGTNGHDGKDGKDAFCRCAKTALEAEFKELSEKTMGRGEFPTLAQVLPKLAEVQRLLNDSQAFEETRIRNLLAEIRKDLG